MEMIQHGYTVVADGQMQKVQLENLDSAVTVYKVGNNLIRIDIKDKD
jgi:hypothetical protein